MDYNKHKEYYKLSYKNGADFWTHLPIKLKKVKKLAEKLPTGGTVLDIASGRGLIAKHLAEMGFKVLGVDFEGDIVAKANNEIKDWKLEGKVKFVEADAFQLPFTDASFDGVCDFGMLENLHQEDWESYATEINRVLKPGGFYLNVTLSRKTKTFLGFSPAGSTDGELIKHDVHYHFFEKSEVENIFNKKMNLISDEVEFVHEPSEIALLQTLWQKKV